MSFSKSFLSECIDAIHQINPKDIEAMADILHETRERNGRLFLIGSGGGGGNA